MSDNMQIMCVKPSELAGMIVTVFAAGENPFVHGPPGIGKSSIIRQVALQMERQVLDVRAVTLDPTDLRGLPHVNGDGLAHWCPPAWLPHDPESTDIIFMDELPLAPPMVQNSALQLVLDRRVGEYVVPKNVLICAAGNRVTDRSGVHSIPMALRNRFCHFLLEVDNADWLSWAVTNALDTRVINFIRSKPAALFNFDPTRNDNSFPTPRSWHFVSKLIKKCPPAYMRQVVASAVGHGAAGEFMAFVKIYQDLPDVGTVLKDPDRAEVPSDPSVCYAMCGALVEYLAQHPDNAATWSQYVVRLRREYTALVLRDGIARLEAEGKNGQRLVNLPTLLSWMRDNRDLYQFN